jgi:aminoglycoside phosphotransferase (APT) family kinase protein
MITDLPGLSVAALDDWLRRELHDLVGSGPWSAEVISGGLSNITYRLTLETGNVILRRPPLGTLLPTAHDMAREYRILDALAPTDVPVPTVLRLCTDADVLGQPFYLMADIAGTILRTPPDAANLTKAERANATDSFIRALAVLHGLDAQSVGLGDYGRPDGYCARQVRRWGEQWQRSKTRDLPDMSTLLAKLGELIPTDSKNAIVHGDYRLDNVILDPTRSCDVSAVLDWELSTLGDPLTDLGMTMTYWHDRGDSERAEIPVAAGITVFDGFATSRELAQTYAQLTGADLTNLSFYLAFGAMKLAVILEGIHSRYLGGKSVGDGYDTAGQAVPVLVASGLRHLTSGL